MLLQSRTLRTEHDGHAPNAIARSKSRDKPRGVIVEETITPQGRLVLNLIFQLNHDRSPLEPVHPAVARQMLRAGVAAVFRRAPFTVIRKAQVAQPSTMLELRIDPGATTTGLVLVHGDRVIFAAELTHRGKAIRAKLEARGNLRGARRNRNLRHRAKRFDNRTRRAGWLPPSIQSRVDNVVSWARKLASLASVASIAIEQVRFDTQAMQNPEISGVEYQQGALAGYEVREYLLEKLGRSCAYCDKKDTPLEVEHIVPRSRGGSDRVSNLTLACRPCNQRKGNAPAAEFVNDPARLRKILARSKAPLAGAAAVNAARFAIVAALKATSLPVSCWTGGRTKFNRCTLGYPKAHWIDAACVGENGAHVRLDPAAAFLKIKALGRGSRQTCRVDRFGFPRSAGKRVKRVAGFSSNDLVRLNQSSGKYAGAHVGLVSVRERGDFDVTSGKLKITSKAVNFVLLQRADGYGYAA
ncbi:MAG: RNA-guided endonuclease IscB [Candidatus Velthaea sp.]